jgi:hypothetical protein
MSEGLTIEKLNEAIRLMKAQDDDDDPSMVFTVLSPPRRLQPFQMVTEHRDPDGTFRYSVTEKIRLKR